MILIDPYRFATTPGEGGGGSADTYTHFRLLIDAGQAGGSGIGIEDLVLYGQDGAESLVRIWGGTASASSEYGGSYAAHNAFDTSVNSKWFTTGMAGEWLQWEFAEAHACPVFSIRPDDASSRWPLDFRLQGSNDGTNWTDLHTTTGKTDWVADTYHAFTTVLGDDPMAGAGSYEHYKFVFFRTATGPRLWEVELRATVSGPDVATGGTITYSSQLSGSYAAAYTFDDSLSTRWIGNVDNPTWIAYQLAAAAEVVEYAIWGDASLAPEAWLLLGSNDGSTWTALTRVTGETAWGAKEERTFSV